MSKSAKQPPADKVALYDKLISTNPNIERKGVTSPYTSANGNMFTYLSQTGLLGIRLPKEEREAFLVKYQTKLFESHGAIMKEYVTVPAELLGDTAALQPYLEASFAYVQTLKPKPTKKKSG